MSIGAGTGGAHAEMFLKIRSPAALASVTDSVMPGMSAGRPFAFENPDEERALRVVAAHELQKAVVRTTRVDRDQARGDAERIHLTGTILEDVGQRPLVGVVPRHDVVDEVRLHADGDEILHDARELVGDRQRLNLRAGDLRRRRTVQRFRPLPRLVQHLGVQRPDGARVGLDVRRGSPASSTRDRSRTRPAPRR